MEITFPDQLSLFQENISFVIPWIIGFITFMALEAVAMVYSNVLRDHVNRVGLQILYNTLQSTPFHLHSGCVLLPVVKTDLHLAEFVSISFTE